VFGGYISISFAIKVKNLTKEIKANTATKCRLLLALGKKITQERGFMKMSALLLAIFAIFVGGCSTYKARDKGIGNMGYEEKKLEDGTYFLSYYGSSFDGEEDVREKWNRRAIELCGKGKFQSDVSTKEWTYDGYIVLPPLIFKTDAVSPLIEGKLACNK